MEFYKVDSIIKVRVSDFYKSSAYAYIPEKRFAGIKTSNGGYYYIGVFSKSYIGNNVPKNHTLIGGVLYENPEVRIYYKGGKERSFYFDTYDKAVEFAKKVTDGGDFQLMPEQ